MMKGTEKQIAWATEILATVNAIYDDMIAMISAEPKATEAMKAAAAERINARRALANEADYAGDIISLFRDVKRTDDPLTGIGTLMSVYRITAPETVGQRKILGK